MEKRLNFEQKLSLKEMTLRTVLVNLWNESDIVPTIQNFRIKDTWKRIMLSIKRNREWLEVEKKVKKKVSKLLFPDPLKEDMMHLVQPIGYQILRWKSTHQEFQSVIPEKLCWTSIGMVDNRKTAEKIVRLETFDVEKRYELACWYCLEDCITLLWGELPEEYKKRLSSKSLSNNFPGELPLEVYWAYVVEGEKSKLDFVFLRQISEGDCLYRRAFESSARIGNKVGVDYFFQKLTDEEKHADLLETAFAVTQESRRPHYGTISFFRQENFSDVLCYLLSKMSPGQQIQVFKKHPWDVLPCFLVWPWQDLFWDVADLICTFLPERDYGLLMFSIFHDFNTSYYFPSLIHTFSLSSLNGFKNRFVRDLLSTSPELLFEDQDTIKVFLRNVDPVCRARLVLDSCFLSFLDKLMSKNKWNLVEVCVREAALSKEDRERLRQVVLKGFCPKLREGKKNRRKGKLTRFYELLEEIEARFSDK